MKTFLLFVGLPFAAVMTFFSGLLPYTLIYDETKLLAQSYEGDRPLTVKVVKCEVQETRGLRLGSPMDTTFRVMLENHTNRYVVISAMGEVFEPKGRSVGIHSKLFVLSPNSLEDTVFQSNTPFTTNGRYKCQVRYAIGRFDY